MLITFKGHGVANCEIEHTKIIWIEASLNPTDWHSAMCRIHAIGETEPIYCFETVDTIKSRWEECIKAERANSVAAVLTDKLDDLVEQMRRYVTIVEYNGH